MSKVADEVGDDFTLPTQVRTAVLSHGGVEHFYLY